MKTPFIISVFDIFTRAVQSWPLPQTFLVFLIYSFIGWCCEVAYVGIFIGAIVRFTKKAAETPEVIAPALCILAYMAHNFFCYQQIICTPIIFLIIGGGECLCRYGLRPIWEDDGD